MLPPVPAVTVPADAEAKSQAMRDLVAQVMPILRRPPVLAGIGVVVILILTVMLWPHQTNGGAPSPRDLKLKQQAEDLWQNRQFDQAEQIWQGLVKNKGPLQKDASQHVSQIDQKRADEAAQQNARGAALLKDGKFGEAAAELQKAAEAAPKSAVIQSNLGYAYDRQGRTDEAIVSLKTALQLKPDYLEALEHLGHVLLQQARLTPGKDVKLIYLKGMVEILTGINQGNADAGIFTSPTTLKAQHAGLKELVNVTEQNIPMIHAALASTKEYIKTRRDDARRGGDRHCGPEH